MVRTMPIDHGIHGLSHEDKSPNRIAINVNGEVLSTSYRLDIQIFYAWNSRQGCFYFFRERVNTVEILAINFYTNISTDTCCQHIDPVDDRLCPTIHYTGYL